MKKYITIASFTCLLFSTKVEAATATFSYTFSNPACSSTVTKGCISGFAVGTVTSASTTTPAAFVQMAACPLPPTTTGTVNSISCTFTGTAPLGPTTFAVVATYVDTNGNPGISPLSASNETNVTVTPSSPSGVVIVFP